MLPSLYGAKICCHAKSTCYLLLCSKVSNLFYKSTRKTAFTCRSLCHLVSYHTQVVKNYFYFNECLHNIEIISFGLYVLKKVGPHIVGHKVVSLFLCKFRISLWKSRCEKKLRLTKILFIVQYFLNPSLLLFLVLTSRFAMTFWRWCYSVPLLHQTSHDDSEIEFKNTVVF